VVNEILYWKKNRLLPEHYCDYLLALYTEGNDSQSKENGKSSIMSPKESIKFNPLYIAVIFLSILGIFISEFTSFNFVYQGLILLMIVIALLGITYMISRKSLNYQVPLIASAFILLLLTVKFVEFLFPQNLLMLYISLFVHCIGWIVLGLKLKLTYFNIAGMVGGLLVLYFLGRYAGFL
jgi:hypothetical protein